MAAGTKTNVNCTKDLTGVSPIVKNTTTGVLGFVAEQSVIIEPIADDTYTIAVGDTITTVNGIITAYTPA